jgi:hypothetical protein
VYVSKLGIDRAVIDREKPDVVIFEIVERKLGALVDGL